MIVLGNKQKKKKVCRKVILLREAFERENLINKVSSSKLKTIKRFLFLHH